jgi:hypothetical protein
VGAEEAGVQAESEDDLGHGAEEDEQGQVPVVLRGEEPDVEGQEEDGDDVREDIGRPVDGRLGGELAKVGQEYG